MNIICKNADFEDLDALFQLNKQLIDEYENIDSIDYDRVLKWVRQKIQDHINEYSVIYLDGKKAGFYHFYINDDAVYELDDLFIFSEFQNQGIGSSVIRNCCDSVDCPVILYVFIKNTRAVSLYKRLGFEIVETVNGTRYIMRFNPNRKPYYAAYEERYKTVHSYGVSWSSDISTPIVMEMIDKYHISKDHLLLEIGCGEGRDSRTVIENGYNLLATDISTEAISYCKRQMPQFSNHFRVLDCLKDKLDATYHFIFGIALVHMLVLDEHRNGFYQFIYNHLSADGIALICSMGDGAYEMQSDISKAFMLQERNHEIGKMMVTGTSCRMVSFSTFEKELKRNGLQTIEMGITASPPDFDRLMYAVVRKVGCC